MPRVQKIATFLAASGLLIVAGCTTQPPSTNERNFGLSVKQMIKAQTLNADAEPSTTPIEGLDGQRGENVMKKHRGAVADAKQMPSEVTINVGK